MRKKANILKPFPRNTTKSEISFNFEQIANYSKGPIEAIRPER